MESYILLKFMSKHVIDNSFMFKFRAICLLKQFRVEVIYLYEYKIVYF